MMGFFDLIGTTASGYLTDCVNPKRLLAVFFGLDWIATVPPTVKLADQSFGERNGPIVFGWVLVAHQPGAAVAAYGAGVIREQLGTYNPALLTAGAFAILASLAFILDLDGRLHSDPTSVGARP